MGNSLKGVRVPFMPPEDIERAVEDLREKCELARIIPVDVIALAEYMGIVFSPRVGLSALTDMDALVLGNMKEILVDHYNFMAEGGPYNRLRFSIAHELGHITLHNNLFGQLNFTSPKDWMDFIQHGISDKDYNKIEFQAH